MEKTLYEKKEVFQSQIVPLLKQIDTICGQNQLPYFFTAAVTNTDSNTEYESRARTGIPMGVYLTKDQVTSHVKVSAGFDVILPDTIPDIEL